MKTFGYVSHFYNRSLQIFLSLHNEGFPKIKVKLRRQNHFRPWITLGIRKSSKREPGLYEKHLETRTAQNESQYKAYKNIFQTIKRKSQRNFYSQKILEHKNKFKKMEYYEGGNRQNKSVSRQPTKLVINQNDVTNEIGIANQFNKFFTNTGPEFAKKIPTASRTFERFLSRIDTTMPADPITINELKETFFP